MSNTLYDTYKVLAADSIAFKSVSTDPQYKDHIKKTAEWFDALFKENNFDSQVITGYDNPLVVAHYETDPKAKTVLVYGHYDVQPAEEGDGWETDPFQLVEKDGRLVARGAVDNKGQVMVHIAAVLDLIEKDNLTYNVTFFLEGNEETGSPNLETFVKEHSDLLKSDYIMISDGEIVGETPVVEVGFRGVVNAQLDITTGTTDLHSGLYGGVAPSAAHELTRLLSKLHDKDNKVAIPGFYDGVSEPTAEQLANNAAIPFDKAEYERMTGCKTMFLESDYDLYTQTGLRPSLEVTGVHSGYTGVGFRNSIPHKAVAKFNLRIVEGQDPEDIVQKFKQFCTDELPDYVDWTFTSDESAPAVIIDTSDSVFDNVRSILKDVYGNKPINKYVGGTIPIISTFKEVLGVPQLLIPLANEDCNMHAVNENFKVDLIKKGLQFSKQFLTSGFE